MTVGLILMTALPPTKGHGHLIKWAREYLSIEGGRLIVFLGTQPSEPMAKERWDAISEYCNNLNQEFHSVRIDPIWFNQEVQQQPKDEDDQNFWDDWRYNILTNISSYVYKPWSKGLDKELILFSSEKYGEKLAETLGCKHVPVDPNRETMDIKATRVREEPFSYPADILPEFLPFVQMTFTIFGAESTGKTTAAKYICDGLDAYQYVHEWARPYLESLPSPETTPERMEVIVNGQYAAQKTAKGTGKLVIIQDTDLLSTIGYYRIYCPDYQELDGYKRCVELFRGTKADWYFLCRSDINFEVDPLRYCGNKRENTDDFWISLLEEFNCNWCTLARSKTTRGPMERYTINQIEDRLMKENPLWGYKREGNV